MEGPIIRSRQFPASVRYHGNRVAMNLKVHAGLHMITHNRKPYFSLTVWEHRAGHPNQCQGGGADHDTILKYWPELKPLAALHLADIDGVPMHAVENGWYLLAGSLGGYGEKYHAGQVMRNFPATPPPDAPWRNYEHRCPTPDECLQFFAQHCRISFEEAQRIREQVTAGLSEDYPLDMRMVMAKQRWAEICESMKPRWKMEAEAAIQEFKLVVYGDAYVPVSGAA